MFDANVKLIRELKEFVSILSSDSELLAHFRCSPHDFLRSRKLLFERIVLLIAKLCKKTLSVEIENFFTESGQGQPCSVSAFVQQRIKLKPLFFSFWNKFLCSTWYQLNKDEVKRWKGYRIVAADGSNVTLVNNDALSKHFGGQRNQYMLIEDHTVNVSACAAENSFYKSPFSPSIHLSSITRSDGG